MNLPGFASKNSKLLRSIYQLGLDKHYQYIGPLEQIGYQTNIAIFLPTPLKKSLGKKETNRPLGCQEHCGVWA